MPIKERVLKWVDPWIRLPVAGLDISDRTIKYLAFRRGKALDFELWGETEIPEGLIEAGEIKNEEGLIRFLEGWLRKEGRPMQKYFAAVSLPEEKSFLRVIQLPKVKKEGVEGAIRWEIEANIPLAPEELTYAYEMMEPPEKHLDHLDVAVTAFPKTLVESYARVLSRAGIRLYSFELESQAIVRSIISKLHERKARLVVDLGRQRSSVIIFSGDAIIFTTTVAVGGRSFEENIAKGFGVNAEEALKIKKEAGLNKKAYGGKLPNALILSLSVLASELKRALKYYEQHTRHSHGVSQKINEVLLAGGDANLDGLDTYLSASLKTPVFRGDPWAGVRDKIIRSIPPIPKNQALGFTTTIGLAMRNLT